MTFQIYEINHCTLPMFAYPLVGKMESETENLANLIGNLLSVVK